MSTFVLMAGGTGGHLFPAMALAQELRRRGHVVDLMTDHRVESYGADFPARRIHVVPAATPSLNNPVKFIGGGFKILGGIGVALRKLREIKPDAVVGFGGYPTFPPFVAASLLGIPGVLHEQNAVLGRANRALCRFANRLALSFEKTTHAQAMRLQKVITGNPVRDRVRDIADTPYPAISNNGPIRLVIFGGSQGARIFSDIVPAAVARMPEDLCHRLHIVQQCRAEDLDRVAEVYRQAKVNVELAAFFDNLPERIAGAHLVVARSGASTITELGVLGRPAIMVPLPSAIDGDQKQNALVLEAAGGGWIVEQASLSPLSLGTRLANLLADPNILAAAAVAAKSLGQPLAVEKLADVAEEMANLKNAKLGNAQ
ncbi:undecaprenyldiphospho-muramoylpentapeptide beta-N-acetylglucosaminyltransferase [Devosia algicola]|uniref:UDP-N-acetylglucosamine--N-acetylmuramyl-(pentapeptide) pyrophosphoryl-undecaprenol N-acetylglucosamine transferase n=1 Tax=Devosia algicola TaxID=3026418 RepID=A0ABY7YRY7_9HYPH|nr:undecaprenyldiphospho-muramoylpentapeptide beta-N-acetylglucosaminyltransferase [Devosia algicola]WDR03835.1 undecaprenyldiphospho-muramoylpentapeptide beta-N-acetylglucosaminyltransferase [Devosia algicola]